MRVVCVCEKKCQKCLNNCIPFQAIKQNGAGGFSFPLEKIPAWEIPMGGVGSRTVKFFPICYCRQFNSHGTIQKRLER